MPLHYLLALKHPYSPLQLLTRLSHEQLNRGHQILGRIITIFFYAHGVLYFNSFIQLHTVVEHLKGRVVLLGLLGLVFFAIINTTSLSVLRAWSYRVFFVTHIALAILLLPVLFFHVSHIRLYIWECLVIYLVNTLTRYMCSRTYHGTVSLLSKGDLIKIDIPVDQNATFWRAGDHVYLTLIQHRGMKTPKEVFGRLAAGFRSNPFTIASIPSRDARIVLVARVREGSTRRLASLPEQSVRLRLEGPYGAARYLPDLTSFDEVLLVAGGAGATFVVPIFRDLISELSKHGPASRIGRVKLLWFVRNLADADWAVPEDEDGKQIWEQNTEVVVTGARSSGSLSTNSTKLVNGGKEGNPVSAEREEIEMEEQEALLNEDIVDEESGATTQQASDARGSQGRARLFECMDQVFARDAEGSVALLVCGPPGMAHTARKEARRWAKKGRQVFFHAEEFGL
ncbi:MAG: hypothetical protein M1821_004695 [Bathelium mastoideum]|nr:MAG: hypothetical protein M1821_004695 [Bathelium mastoideum]